MDSDSSPGIDEPGYGDRLVVVALTLLLGGGVVALVGQHTAAQAGPAIVLSLLLAGCATPVTAPAAPTEAAPALTACPEGVPAGARCELIGTQLTGNLELAPGASVKGVQAWINGSLNGDTPGLYSRFDIANERSLQVDNLAYQLSGGQVFAKAGD